MSKNYTEIIPGLWVGDQDAARRPPREVCRIINCAEEFSNIAPLWATKPQSYMKIGLTDVGDFEDLIVFSQSIRKMIEFVNSSPLEDKPVLYHCAQGISRSASMAAAYLCSSGMTPQKAVDLLRAKRPCVFDFGTCELYRPALDEHFG
jgi:atypical dual specificity phosphatase